MNLVKKIIFILLFVLMYLPLIQDYFKLYDEEKLDGAYSEPKKPDLSMKAWLGGTYQDNMNRYIDKSLGFHNTLVRIRNQFQYSFFRKVNVKNQMAGKNNYLYSVNWTKKYLGIGFSRDTVDQDKINRIKFLKEIFEKNNKLFLNIIAPTKSSYIPEYLPSEYAKTKRSKSYYDVYIDLFDSLKIRYIDCHKYFQDMKDTVSYPLFTYSGCHWSYYGAVIVLDSILNYIEDYLQKPLIKLNHAGLELTNMPQKTDNDIEKAMNLLFPLERQILAYPKLKVIKNNTSNRPKVIVIGDSFYWVIMGTWVLADIYSTDSWFWYYFKTAYPKSEGSSLPVEELDILSEIESADVVLFVSSIATLDSYPYGFAKKYMELLKSSADARD